MLGREGRECRSTEGRMCGRDGSVVDGMGMGMGMGISMAMAMEI